MFRRELRRGDWVRYLQDGKWPRARLDSISGRAIIDTAGTRTMVPLESLQLYPCDDQGLPKKLEPGDQVVQRGIRSVPGTILRLDPASTFRVLLWDGVSDPIPWRMLK